MGNFKQAILGKTGLKVGRLGVAASYGAPTGAYEEAFEKGCNYFYFGSGRRRAGMKQAIRNLCRKGKRDKIIISLHTYARNGVLIKPVIMRRLRTLGLEQADILLLGFHNSRPFQFLLDQALKMKDQGLFRFIGMSGHNRSLFPDMINEGLFDLFHVRYNAAHRGAETEVFPCLKKDDGPGIVTYTATRWGHLLKQEKMPAGESPLSAGDCYRFVLSNPAVDVCLCGPGDIHQMREALKALEFGPLSSDETTRIREIGDYVHQMTSGFFV